MYFLKFLDVMFIKCVKFPNQSFPVLNLFPSQMSTHDPHPFLNYPISIIEQDSHSTPTFVD